MPETDTRATIEIAMTEMKRLMISYLTATDPGLALFRDHEQNIKLYSCSNSAPDIHKVKLPAPDLGKMVEEITFGRHQERPQFFKIFGDVILKLQKRW